MMQLSEWLKLILQYWIPPLITVIAGGVIAALLVPRFQERFETFRQYGKRRLELLESASTNFELYITNWRRLIDISNLKTERERNGQILLRVEMGRLNTFVEARNQCRDNLLSALNQSLIYYDGSAIETIHSFIEWDNDQSTKRLHELPPISEWENKKKTLLGNMKKQAVIDPLGLFDRINRRIRTVLRVTAVAAVFLALILISVRAVGDVLYQRNLDSGGWTSASFFPIPVPKPCPHPSPTPGPPLPFPSPDCPGPGCPCHNTLIGARGQAPA